MSRQRKLPLGRLGRLSRVARVGARTGASLLLSKDGSAAAEHAAEVLGTLRGLAAKVGQMAGYVDGMVPEPHKEAYAKALAALRAQAPTSSPEQIRNLVEEELGAPVDKLFAEWDSEPFASASIGQVHRARLEDGREVAVKVQHPGIDQAVETDLANASVVQALVGSLGPKSMNVKQVFGEIRDRFREELDYLLEAQRQAEFAELHAGDPTIRIPATIQERTSRRVLTSELVRGHDLEAAALRGEVERRQHAETLWRFVFKGTLVGKVFNADPHPGNYIFHEEGSITFLDFGCVQPIAEERNAHARSAHRAALSRDEQGFREAAKALLQTRGGGYEKAALDYTRRCFEPLMSSPFHITPDYVASLVREVGELKRFMWAKDKSFSPLPAGMVFLNRLQFGFYSVLAQLDVQVDYAQVERQFLALEHG